jgi:hypothetical protein
MWIGIALVRNEPGERLTSHGWPAWLGAAGGGEVDDAVSASPMI